MSGNATPPSDDNFASLLSDLDALAKSLPTLDDVQAIHGAADNDDDPDNDGDADGDKDGDGDGKPMAKSMRVMGVDGVEIEAFDGGELIKSLIDQQTKQGDQMTKAMTGIVGHLGRQDALMKSLIEQVAALSGQGRGRKSALTVHDRGAGAETTPLAKGGQQELTCADVLAKASSMFAVGKGGFTAMDISRIEARLNRGEAAPADLVARVQAAS